MEIDVQVKALRSENDGEAKNDASPPEVVATQARVHHQARTYLCDWCIPNKNPYNHWRLGQQREK
ncbi:MAG: hypothetical protein CM1200mP16_14990 [Nitrospina sp.]|nr:MAG: hypothetical protein CM1200mP16_14990 [Nitrospina sp.]